MIRILDLVFSVLGIILLSPLLLIVALAIKLDSPGPVFFRQQRVGRHGSDFYIFKFRSMRQNAGGSLITVGGRDPRITRSGYYIRKFKLDEFPQLFNVILGDMSIVGPRPEVRKYTALYNTEQQKVLTVRPGITDTASIEFSNESELLANAADPEKLYIEKIMPEKIKLNMEFIQNPKLHSYFRIILRTILKIWR